MGTESQWQISLVCHELGPRPRPTSYSFPKHAWKPSKDFKQIVTRGTLHLAVPLAATWKTNKMLAERGRGAVRTLWQQASQGPVLRAGMEVGRCGQSREPRGAITRGGLEGGRTQL